MRSSLLLLSLICLSVSSFAQSAEPAQRPARTKPVVYSASSDWQRVSFKPTTRLRPAQPESVPKPPTQPLPAAPVQRDITNQVTPTTVPAAKTASVVSGSPEPAQTSSNSAPVSQPEAVAEVAPSRRSTPPAPTAAGYRPAFTGDFATNRNGWKAGNKGDYNYQIGLGKYNVRKRNVNTTQVAFSYVSLPSEINLNIAETFTIKVDIVADSGRVPTGGLLFGVADSLNYAGFSLNSRGEISIIRVANGETFSDYMPGEYFKPGILLEKNRDRLTVRRNGDALHFYINDQEVLSSPYPFKLFSGNGIGLTTTGYWTSFQKLTVTLGP